MPESLEHLDAPPLFVVGHVRSGTTWTYELITGHPRVAGIFESWLFEAYAGFFAPEHWDAAYLSELRTVSGHASGLAQLISREEMVAEIRDQTARWLGRALSPSDKYLVERSPAHIFNIPLIAEVWPEARFVFVIRDGRDVVTSVQAASESWNPGWAPQGRRMVGHWAQSWVNFCDLAATRLQELESRGLAIKYEDLRGQTEKELMRLFDFAGFAYTQQDVRSAIDGASIERHMNNRTGFRRSGTGGEWMAKWTKREQQTFETIAAGTMRQWGYARSDDES